MVSRRVHVNLRFPNLKKACILIGRVQRLRPHPAASGGGCPRIRWAMVQRLLYQGLCPPPPRNHAGSRPRLSGDRDQDAPGGGGSEAKKKVVYLQSTSKFGPL